MQEVKDPKDLYYTIDELKRFFELAETTEEFHTIVMFRLLAFTGARKNEIQALLWSDIDFKNSTISITKTLAEDEKYNVIINPPKSKASNRVISIDPLTLQMLRKWRVKQKELFFRLGFNSNDKKQPCFTNLYSNCYLRKNYLNYRLNTICKTHNFKKITIHGFRHTHCSLLLESGISVQEAQERLGHSDIKVTMKIYAHVTERQKEEVGKKFAKYVNF